MTEDARTFFRRIREEYAQRDKDEAVDRLYELVDADDWPPSEVLQARLVYILSLLLGESPGGPPWRAGKQDVPLLTSIDELNLPSRPYNCLKTNGITTLGKLSEFSEAQLLRLPHFGQVSLAQVKDRLAAKYGVTLARTD